MTNTQTETPADQADLELTISVARNLREWTKVGAAKEEAIAQIKAEAIALGEQRRIKQAELDQARAELGEFLQLARDSHLVEVTQLAEWAGVARSRMYQV